MASNLFPNEVAFSSKTKSSSIKSKEASFSIQQHSCSLFLRQYLMSCLCVSINTLLSHFWVILKGCNKKCSPSVENCFWFLTRPFLALLVYLKSLWSSASDSWSHSFYHTFFFSSIPCHVNIIFRLWSLSVSLPSNFSPLNSRAVLCLVLRQEVSAVFTFCKGMFTIHAHNIRVAVVGVYLY